jgi:hypothetical protein
MTSVDDISMLGSNVGLQLANSQAHLDNFEDYSFAFDAANVATSCSHRELQEILDGGNPATTMTNISRGHAQKTQAPQASISSSYDTDIERLKRYAPSDLSLTGIDQARDLMELKIDTEAREKKVEKLHEMFLSLVNIVTKQGVAM